MAEVVYGWLVSFKVGLLIGGVAVLLLWLCLQ